MQLPLSCCNRTKQSHHDSVEREEKSVPHVSLRNFSQSTYTRDVDHIRSESGSILRSLVEQFQESHSHKVDGERVDGIQRRPFFKGFVVEEVLADFFRLFGSCGRRVVELRGAGAGLTGAVTEQSTIKDQRK